MRADAARRRLAIIDAARVLVAERGSDVPLEAVAEAAGVGIATLYRNFDSRAALLDEVVLSTLAEVTSSTTQALDALADSPEDSVEKWVRQLVEMRLGTLTGALADHVDADLSEAVRDAQAEALASVERLLAAAQERDLVCPDLSALELVVAVGAITRPLPVSLQRAAPGLQERLVSLLLAGLRAPAR